MCSKHVEAWNKFIVKQKYCASSWLITELNILRCTVSKTSKYIVVFLTTYPLISLISFVCSTFLCSYHCSKQSLKVSRGNIQWSSFFSISSTSWNVCAWKLVFMAGKIKKPDMEVIWLSLSVYCNMPGSASMSEWADEEGHCRAEGPNCPCVKLSSSLSKPTLITFPVTVHRIQCLLCFLQAQIVSWSHPVC